MNHLGIRVDASATIGIGHLFRCLNFANYARKNFETITFIAHTPSDFYREKVKEYGFELQTIMEQDDLEFLSAQSYDFVIKDHYTLDDKWEKNARAKTTKLIVIDDCAHKNHKCDIYINQNPVTITPSNLPNDCMILSGLRYAILPETLLNLINKPINNDILISLGGSDPTNELQKCLTAFKDMDTFQFHFIAGKENLNAHEIKKSCAKISHFTYHHFIDNIHELAATMRACITAGGTLLRELIYMQTPCYLITNHDNQIPIADYFKSQNAVFYAGHHNTISTDDIKTSFRNFINNESALKAYKQNMTCLLDGKGLPRITKVITTPSIQLNPATMSHCKVVYDWRNHPTTRQHSSNSTEIILTTHNKWFERKLNDNQSHIFIAQTNNADIGVLRYDASKHGLTVSLYLSSDYHGYGYGTVILLAGIKTLKKNGLTPTTLIAKILEDNKASQNAFKKAGFVQVSKDNWKKDLL